MQVLIGGYDVKDLNVQWLRSKIGTVCQDPVLFNKTIAENIRHGNEDATMEQVKEAARQANAHNFITHLPLGYNTMVSCLQSTSVAKFSSVASSSEELLVRKEFDQSTLL